MACGQALFVLEPNFSYFYSLVLLFEVKGQGYDFAVRCFCCHGVWLLAVVSDVLYLIAVESIGDAIHKLELRAQFEVGQIEITS